MKRAGVLLLIAALLSGGIVRPAHAFDRTGHYVAIYALARMSGFNDDDAKVIAYGSQSLDENDATTAFTKDKMFKEAGEVKLPLPDKLNPSQNMYDIDSLPHMLTGQVFHAITSERNRRVIEQAHIRRIRGALVQATNSREKQQRNRALMYFGQYLHFVADTAAHPNDPFWGHGEDILRLSNRDHVEHQPAKLRLMLTLVAEKLEQFREEERSPVAARNAVEGDADGGAGLVISSDRRPIDSSLRDEIEPLAQTLETSWVPAPSLRENDLLYRFNDTLHDYEGARAEAAVRAVNQSMKDRGRSITIPYFDQKQVISLDETGEPRNTGSNVALFGESTRSIEKLPFVGVLVNHPDLAEERVRATAGALNNARQIVAQQLREEAARHWPLPASPGGIALNPKLRMPADVGTPRDLVLLERGVVLRTSAGEFILDGMEPQSFAVVLRAVASGQIPYITIGSTPSDRPGFATVILSPLFQGTREGLMLYLADIQFKAIFADFPLGIERKLNTQADQIVTGFPGAAGESMRLWITSSNMSLRRDGDRIVPDDHGMRILGETTLLGEVVDDPELNDYTRRLTENWDVLAVQIPVFREVQRISEATALAFWIRDHQVEVDPALQSLPADRIPTPSYAPLVVASGRRNGVRADGVTGGVSLTPEEKDQGPGRQILFFLASWIDELRQSEDRGAVLRWIAIVVAAGLLQIILLPTLVFWIVSLILLHGTGARISFLRWSGIIIKSLLAHWLFCAAAWGVLKTAPGLNSFDQDFVGLLATVVAFPIILMAFVRRSPHGEVLQLALCTAVYSRAAFALLAVGCSLFTAWLGAVSSIVSVAAFGTIPSAELERALTYQIAPASLIDRAAVRAPGSELPPLPPSLLKSMKEPVAFPPEMEVVEGGRIPPGWTDPTMPVGRLQRIQWPADLAREVGALKHYSENGQPPF